MQEITIGLTNDEYTKFEYAAKRLGSTTEDFVDNCLKLRFLKMLNLM